MKRDKLKVKLKNLGEETYIKYFFNSNEILRYILDCIMDNKPIDKNKCDYIFDCDLSSKELIYELCMYYPKKLKEIKIITNEVINNLYNEYGETIMLMNKYKLPAPSKTIRNKLYNSATKRINENINFDIISEDIKLVKTCPFLNIPLEYNNSKMTKYSASLDRIDPLKGYIKDNIQVISHLANRMKNSATPEELLTFSNSIIKMYGDS